MRTAGFLLFLSLLTASCEFVPNSEVRIALPPGDAAAAADWARVAAVLAAEPSPLPVAIVAPDAFPPPDLYWFDGRLDNPSFTDALAANAQVETLGRKAGLAPGWFSVEGDRVFPLAWNPWAWWKLAPGVSAPHPAPDDAEALGRLNLSLQGPTLVPTSPSPTPLGAVDESGRAWRSWASMASVPGDSLTATPADTVVTRVKGLWWSARGWNRERVPALLARLWSAQAQAVWVPEAGWFPATRSPAPTPLPTHILIVR